MANLHWEISVIRPTPTTKDQAMQDSVLVIYEDGERTGHITANGSIGYTGSNSYIEMVLEHFEGGEIYTYSTGSSDGPFKPGTEVESTNGEQLFDSVRARLNPLPDIELQMETGSVE